MSNRNALEKAACIDQRKLTGTGAAINVDLGWQPLVVIAINRTTNSLHMATRSMTAAHVQSVTDNGDGTADIAAVASGGITIGPRGYSLGTDAALNSNANEIHVIALG